MHDANHPTEAVREEPTIDPAHRRALNAGLDERMPEHACAVLFANPKKQGAPKPRPQVIVVRLGRGTTGKPPRRGVHVPLSSYQAVVANTRIHGRAVVNPRHQRPYIKRKDWK